MPFSHQLIMPALVLLLLAPAAAFADDPLLVTLTELKTHYRRRNLAEATGALRRLNELAAAEENAQKREMLLPALSFYTGIIRFELRDEAGAREATERYLRLVPTASLDPSLYPKATVQFFERVRKEMVQSEALATSPSPSSIEGGLLPSFASFPLDEDALEMNERDPEWAKGAVRFLFVEDESKRWKAATDDDSRRRFQADFWSRRDPTPATPANELRIEFARRTQFADANFSSESQRGSVTDRGMVFVLMGAPNYAGRSNVEASDDSVGVTLTTDQVFATSKLGGRLMRVESGTPRLGAGEKMGVREVWYYRADRLSKALPFRELRFEFQTKEGYGIGVLQKDAVSLSALSRMATVISQAR